jgi:hypothetical protein
VNAIDELAIELTKRECLIYADIGVVRTKRVARSRLVSLVCK